MLKLFQPSIYFDDGTNIGWNLPSELCSFQVFLSKEDCEEWLERNDYELSECVIHEYEFNDIEDASFLDSFGEEYDSCVYTKENMGKIIEICIDYSRDEVVNYNSAYVESMAKEYLEEIVDNFNNFEGLINSGIFHDACGNIIGCDEDIVIVTRDFKNMFSHYG